jgi:hypothetical protein
MRRLLLAVLTVCFAGWAAAQGPEKAPAKKPVAAKAAKKANTGPQWAELNAEQQHVLAPLKSDWENLGPQTRRKWIGIAKRYPTMKAEEQERVQRRMQRWAALSPEQRRQARETYKRMAKVPPAKRANLREQWAEYQSLPEREREALSAEPPRKK